MKKQQLEETKLILTTKTSKIIKAKSKQLLKQSSAKQKPSKALGYCATAPTATKASVASSFKNK